MRQRKAKNLVERLENVSKYMVKDPCEMRGRWKEVFGNDRPIYLELGCGKGKFIRSQAVTHRDRNYIGIEGQSTVVLHAMERCEAMDDEMFSNLRFACDFVRDLSMYFEKGELAGIYLNFSDPWPKPRHAKRRLTYRKYLAQYASLLQSGSFIEIKTDNDGLFNFTLGEAEALEDMLEIAVMSRDLHGSVPEKEDGSLQANDCAEKLEAASITTEYEDKFKGLGKNINYVKLRVR